MRTVFSMIAEPLGDRLRETRFARGSVTTLGTVETASYLVPPHGLSPRSLWERLFGGGSDRVPGSLAPPFDVYGRDVLGLFSQAHEPLDAANDPVHVVRHIRGRIHCLLPREHGDSVVVRDAWMRRPAVRVTSAVHFALDTGSGPPVAVAFEQSPLLVASPRVAPLEDVLEDVDGKTAAAIASRAGVGDWAWRAEIVELREGEEIEAVGMTSEPTGEHARFDLHGQSASYRDAPRAVERVLGDAPGMRMILRRVG